MRTWLALTVLAIGVGIATFGAYLSAYQFATNPNPNMGVALVGVFVLIVAVATIGTAIDGIFTEEEYAPMGWLSLRSRIFKELESADDQDVEPDRSDDESD